MVSEVQHAGRNGGAQAWWQEQEAEISHLQPYASSRENKTIKHSGPAHQQYFLRKAPLPKGSTTSPDRATNLRPSTGMPELCSTLKLSFLVKPGFYLV